MAMGGGIIIEHICFKKKGRVRDARVMWKELWKVSGSPRVTF